MNVPRHPDHSPDGLPVMRPVIAEQRLTGYRAAMTPAQPVSCEPVAPTPANFTARLQATGQTFAAPSHLPLLQSAQLAGIELASSCRNGTCRACRCQLVSGSVAYQIEWPGLSPDEKRSGLILPCVARPTSDVVLADAADD